MFGENGYLKRIVETTVGQVDGVYTGKPHNGEPEFSVDETTKTTMITYGFHPNIFDLLETDFEKFLETNKNDLEKIEFYIPNVVQHQIDTDSKKVMMLETSASWHGITYKEDLTELKESIAKYHDNGEYPNPLW